MRTILTDKNNKGNNLFDSNFEEAEKNYRIAIDDSSNDLRAAYNLSNKYYNLFFKVKEISYNLN